MFEFLLFILSLSQAETTQADLRPEQQAKQQISVQPYATFSRRQKNYLYISTGTNRVSVGNTLSLKLSITTEDQSHRELIKHITYLVRQELHMTISIYLKVIKQEVKENNTKKKRKEEQGLTPDTSTLLSNK